MTTYSDHDQRTLDEASGRALDRHPVATKLGRPLHLDAATRQRALALLNSAIDYGSTALTDLDSKRQVMTYDDIIDVLINLRDLREIISSDPDMERPIGNELHQEWMR